MDFVVSCNSFLIQLDWLVIIMLNNTNSDQLNSIICPKTSLIIQYCPLISELYKWFHYYQLMMGYFEFPLKVCV